MFKKILSFLELCAWVVGTLGGFGWCAFNHAWLIALCIVALAVMAFPCARQAFKELAD
jgi:hypothetical protein